MTRVPPIGSVAFPGRSCYNEGADTIGERQEVAYGRTDDRVFQ
jgi:hypothetical protein